MAHIAGGVAFEFFAPPSRPCLRNPGVFAVPVQMPETAVDKYTNAVSRKNDVGIAWKIPAV